MPERPEATPDDPAAVLLKEFEALQEDLSSLRRKHAELAQAGASQEQRLARAEEDAAFWRGAAERYHEQLGAKAAEVERFAGMLVTSQSIEEAGLLAKRHGEAGEAARAEERARRLEQQLEERGAEVAALRAREREWERATRDAAHERAAKAALEARARGDARDAAPLHAEKAALKRKNAELREKLGASELGRQRQQAASEKEMSQLSKKIRVLKEQNDHFKRGGGPGGALPDNRGGGGAIRQRTTGVFGGGAARYSPW